MNSYILERECYVLVTFEGYKGIINLRKNHKLKNEEIHKKIDWKIKFVVSFLSLSLETYYPSVTFSYKIT